MNCLQGNDIELAAGILRSGGLVGMPTETVYGLAGNALDAQAVARIFEAKGRPHFDPLIVHIPELSWLERVACDIPVLARTLMARFWPGPLTLILPKVPEVPHLVTAGLETVAVRIPQHPMALELLRRTNLPLAAPSANLFGRISPTTALHVADQLGDKIAYILDGGPCRVGLESTILRLDPTPCLLRPGGIALEDLESVIGPIDVLPSTDNPGSSPQVAPGMLPQHYAPRTRLELIDCGESLAIASHRSPRVGLLVFQQCPPGNHPGPVEVLSESGDLREAAVRFFAALRRLDDSGVDVIIAQAVPDHGLGRALNDRLRRAATRIG